MPQVSLPQMAAAVATSCPTTPVLVSFPTDTVPALAAPPDQASVIYTAKRRSPEKPLILMGASFTDLLPYIAGETEVRRLWQTITDQYWPGQLTLVLPASDRVSSTLNPTNTGTLGIRVPNHPIALDLLSRTGPLATTSANLSGKPPLTNIADIARTFPTALTLPAAAFATEREEPSSPQDAPVAVSGTPSTVALWTGHRWQILRQGAIYL